MFNINANLRPTELSLSSLVLTRNTKNTFDMTRSHE